MPSRWIFALVALLLTAPPTAAAIALPRPQGMIAHQAVPVRGGTCKSVSSCREAVELWCGGYGRADGDHDGIPCENVCHSRQQVQEIQKEIGCD